MSLFEWKPLFSVHIETIDTQHQKLVSYMNGFYDAHSKNQNVDAKRHLNDLLAFTQKHFTEEEQLMEKTGYADIANHKESHKNLLSLVIILANEYTSKPNKESGDKLANFLKNWLSGHILGVDKKYGPHMQSKGVH